MLLGAALLFAGFNTGNNLFHLLAAGLLSAFLVGFAAARSILARASVSVHVASRGRVAEPLGVRVSVRNRGQRVPIPAIEWRITASTGERTSLVTPPVGAGSESSGTGTLLPRGRGRMTVSSIAAWTDFPLGLSRTAIDSGPYESISIVHPRISGETCSAPSSSGLEDSGSGRSTSAAADPERAREYSDGDDSRLIDWKATARSSRVIVRDRSGTPGRSVMLTVEPGEGEEFEQAISQTAGAAISAIERGDAVGLVVPGRRLAPAGGQPHLKRILDVLALCEPRRRQDDSLRTETHRTARASEPAADSVPEPHPTASLLALAAGVGASVAAGALGTVAAGIAGLALLIGFGRTRGWTISSGVARPVWFRALALAYLPLFVADLFASLESDPVSPLARLVLFLAVVEALSGEESHPLRPLLLGTLLMIVGAAETTDLSFAMPLAAFSVAAAASLARHSARAAAPPGGIDAETPWRLGVSLAGASAVVALLLFLVIPHGGAGWGSRPFRENDSGRLTTGLADEVTLGSIGRVKKLRSVALRARLVRGEIEEQEIYWRARTFESWTGSGWRRDPDPDLLPARLRPGRRMALGRSADPPSTVLDIRLERPGLSELVLPGSPSWIEAAERSTIALEPGGLPVALHGAGPRRYRLALIDSAPGDAGLGIGPDDLRLETSPQAAQLDDDVHAWAESVAPGEHDADRLARAFVEDLSSREYSLDTRSIDPSRPIASMLEGSPAHCEYFASAMALGLRARGVPARVVGGYLGADRLPLWGELLVREERAHLWVEVLIDGKGWVRFDPTPAAGRSVRSSGPAAVAALGDWIVVAWDSWIIGLDFSDQRLLLLDLLEPLSEAATSRVFWLAGLALSAALAILAAVAWLAGSRSSRTRSPTYYRKMLAIAARKGLVPESGETSREFARRCSETLGNEPGFRALSRMYERERFAARPPRPRERALARRLLRRMATGRAS
jgi:uncharacterized protein (DUF58 family)